MSEAPVWNGFSQAALDAAYNNMAAVADSADRLASWVERSAALRASHPGELDIAYGPGERQGVDLFRCGQAGAPMLAFIHGGWWQRNSRQVFSCLAHGPLAHGFDVAMIGYTLAPEARLTAMVAEIHAALDLIGKRCAPASLVLGGWSAGGHLTAMALDHPLVRAGLSISGVFDLEPIRLSYINDRLGLDVAEARAMSPIDRPAVARPLVLAYGAAELPELCRQSEDFGVWRAVMGAPTQLLPCDGEDHFSILDQLERPDGRLTAMLRELAAV